MGVPKFYRWISERYPCLSEVVKEYQIPEFDNLYLDFNGIVHNCSHPEDDNPHFRITEEKIFEDIFHYVEVLFRMIRPRKVFFMAIDGVAPRAKMNQQRGRRFRSAREAEELERKAIEKGEILPKEQRFDSNCITPGTPFMVRLHEQLKYFLTRKISEDKMWQGLKVYLSGHETPGEGEHKIMDFIRHEKAKPDYDPNTRHCLYGLDADLIMLGLVSHEPHFSLLREEVRFGGKNAQKRSTVPEEITFHLLHLSLLREYLDFEFSPVRDKVTFDYDLERIIDDWVLMGFLVGNDFIPHLPNLHINHDALPMLWKTYIKVLPTLDGYLNEHGRLNLPRFEKYLTVLSQYDLDQFNEQYADLKWFEGKTGKKNALPCEKWLGKKKKKSSGGGSDKANGSAFSALLDIDDDDFQGDETADSEIDLNATSTTDGDDNNVNDTDEQSGEPTESSEDDMFLAEFRHHKASYYRNKLEYDDVTEDVLQEQAYGYVRAIQWILHYYFNGVPSWGWFYAHHYAPYLSDVKNFSDMKIEFDLGTPFLPFEQLMAVLPAASKSLLPAPLQTLMVNDTSPIVQFYPSKFETDLNGKQQDWEAVVLIPFIDEEKLLRAIRSMEDHLDPEEKSRNRHGPHLMFQHTDESLGEYRSPGDIFPSVTLNHANMTAIDQNEFRVPIEAQKLGLCDNVRLDVYFPGFPTLKHVPHRAFLKKAGVKVFQMNSRGENMMLQILADGDPQADLNKIASDYLGESIFVGWPHLLEARVVSVADGSTKISIDESDQKQRGHGKKRVTQLKTEKMNQDDIAIWHRQSNSITERYHDSRGVDVGTTFVLLYCTPMMGRKYVCGSHGNVTLTKQWAENPVPYALQTTVKDISVHDSSFAQFKTLDELFPKGSPVFMLGFPNYGCQGEVLEIDPTQDGRIRINFTIKQEPDLQTVASNEQSLSLNYVPGYIVGQRIGVSGHLVSRLTGTIYLNRGSREATAQQKANIGLNLKFNKRNEEVPGYTRKSDNGWLYSTKTVDILSDYSKKFPEVFSYLAKSGGGNDSFYEEDMFTAENRGKRYQALVEYLKQLPSAKVQRMQHGTEFLDEQVVKAIEAQVDEVSANSKGKKTRMQVKPHLLYRPLDHTGTLIPDHSTTYQMFDRVVNVREGYSVPLGLRGTVIGIVTGEKETDKMYEIVFDEEFLSGLACRCSPNRGYRLPAQAMINLSHGLRKQTNSSSKMSAKTAQMSSAAVNGSVRNAWTSKSDKIKKASNGIEFVRSKDTPVINSKMSREDFLNLGRAAKVEQQRQKSQVDADFANTWNDLRGPSGKTTFQNTPPNLNDAAQALVRQFSSDQTLAAAKNNSVETKPDRTRGSRDVKPSKGIVILKNDKQHLTHDKKVEKQTENIERTSKMSEPSKKESTDELNALFKVLSAKESNSDQTTNKSEQTTSKIDAKVKEETSASNQGIGSRESMEHATQSLKKMLNLPVQDASEKPLASQYGKSVSLQEMFHYAKEAQKAAPKPQVQQTNNTRYTAVEDLATWSSNSQIPPPHYDHFPTGEGLFFACVTLGTGLRVQGSACRTKEQASESSAAMALLQVSRHTASSATSKHQATGRQPSAFTPVSPLGPGDVSHPVSHVGQVQPRPQQYAIQARPQFPTNYHYHPLQPRSYPYYQQQFQQARPQWAPPHHHQQQQNYQGIHAYHPGQMYQHPIHRHQNYAYPHGGGNRSWHTNQHQHHHQQQDQQRFQQQQHYLQSHQQVALQQQQQQWQGAGQHQQHHHQIASGGQEAGEGRVRQHSGNSNNPFVPLQVSKKMATPQKEKRGNSKDTDSDKEKSPKQNVSSDPAVRSNSADEDGKSAQYASRSKPQDTASKSAANTKTRKRPKSRLAANFGGAKD